MKKLTRNYKNGRHYSTTTETTFAAYLKAVIWLLGSHRSHPRKCKITPIKTKTDED